MTLQALAFAALMTQCAPKVAPSTMGAVVRVESGGDPLAIGDNTARRSYHPRNRAGAEALAQRLLEAGHSLDLGPAQIDSIHFAGSHVNVHTIFDPCTNVSIGARILSEDYAFAARRYGNGQIALRHAIGMYNTGRLDAGARYVRLVLVAAGIQQEQPDSPGVAPQLGAIRSPSLVRVAIVRRSSITRQRTLTPSRSPILVTITRTSPVTIF